MGTGTQAALSGSADLSPQAGEFRLGHRPWLDGLRGIAILAVLTYHVELLPLGFLGVDLFFVLSGFLITCLLTAEHQRRGAIRLGRFYLRRVLRLMPALAVLLLVAALGGFYIQHEDAKAVLQEVLVAGCYLSNWPALHQVPMPRLGHTWSLSVEEQFYLFWPPLLVLLLRLRLGKERVLLLVAGMALGCALLRAWLYLRLPHCSDPRYSAGVTRIYAGLDTRGDALLLGCLIGLLASWGMLPRRERIPSGLPFVLACAGLGLNYVGRHWHAGHRYLYLGGFSAFAMGAALLIVCMLVAPPPLLRRLLESRPLVATGRLSYGLYLYHILFMVFLKPALDWDTLPSALLVLGLSFVAAVVSFFVVERPFLRLKDRIAQGNLDAASPRQTPQSKAA